MTEQNAREAMEVWREAKQAWDIARFGDHNKAAAAVIAAKLAEKDAEIARLKKMFAPQWFYETGYGSDNCQDSPHEVIDQMGLKPGHHVVTVDCAGPMPSLWYTVHVLTTDEMNALETDDDVVMTEYPSEAEARQALKPESPDHD